MKPLRSKAHLNFIRDLGVTVGCVICLKPAEAAHIRFSDYSYEKVNPGTSNKDDKWVVPLCPGHHRLDSGCQHDSNEREFWERHGIDPLALAKQLWALRELPRPRAIEEATRIIMEARQ